MKRLTFLAAAALTVAGASAQTVCNTPYADETVKAGEKQIYDIVLGAQSVIDGLTSAGQEINNITVNDQNVFLYIWEGTFVGGDGSFPGVGYDDFQFDGYSSLNVNNDGWSGAGYFVSADAGFSNQHWNDNTRLHVAFRSASSVAPASVTLNISQQDGGGVAADVCLGASVDGKPVVGPALTDEWQAIDISFADLKKFCPGFTYVNTDAYSGNILALSAGNVIGQNVSLDCVFFHTPAGESGVESVEENGALVIGTSAISAPGAAGISLYDMQGRLVKSTASTVLGIDELPAGIYVVKAGDTVKKFVK